MALRATKGYQDGDFAWHLESMGCAASSMECCMALRATKEHENGREPR
jgi:hypothetical protein